LSSLIVLILYLPSKLPPVPPVLGPGLSSLLESSSSPVARRSLPRLTSNVSTFASSSLPCSLCSLCFPCSLPNFRPCPWASLNPRVSAADCESAESSTTDTEGGTTVDPLANDAVLVDFVGLALDSGLFIGVEKKSLPSPEEYEEPGENTLEPVSRLEPRWAWANDDRGRFPDPETDPETETETDAGMSLRCRSRPDVDLRREMDVGSIAIAGSVSLRLPISGRIERGREFCRAGCGLSPRPSPTPYLCIEGEG
jgi:hypothetical protein